MALRISKGVDDNIRVAERHDFHRPADINRNRWRDQFGKPADPREPPFRPDQGRNFRAS